MNILVLHNQYQVAGGEDQVVEAEVALLRERGHRVRLELVSNHCIQGFVEKISAAWNLSYSRKSYEWLQKILAQEPFDLVHVHNFFPLLTPSIYDACVNGGVPVVQTLHNYRLLCANALLLRQGKVCELCIEGSPYNAVLHACYRNSALGSLPVAHMLARHRSNGTWTDKVSRFIAITEFAKSKFIKGGLPADKISVKQNFITDPLAQGEALPNRTKQDFQALFVGRLSEEKGIRTLLRAWRDMKYKITIVGEGPLYDEVANEKNPNILLIGKKPKVEVQQAMRDASVLVLPSECYEGFPMVAVEAIALGLPILSSDLGAVGEFVSQHQLGAIFKAGDALDLGKKIHSMQSAGIQSELWTRSRDTYKKFFTPDMNYQLLMEAYNQAGAKQ